jgi:hypothetical protein
MDSQQSRERMMRWIDEAVADWFGMTIAELHQSKKTRAGVVPRQIASYLMKQIAGSSLAEIGGHFGGQHESTIRHSILKVESMRRTVHGAELTVCGLIEQLKPKMNGPGYLDFDAGQKVLSMTRKNTVAAGPFQGKLSLVGHSDVTKSPSLPSNVIVCAFPCVSERRRTYR